MPYLLTDGSNAAMTPVQAAAFRAAIGADNAANVAYAPGLTGSVARTVEAKLRESVSVLDFGAVGDGRDDTLAIQAALDSHLDVIVGDGRAYCVTGQLSLRSHQTLTIDAGASIRQLTPNETVIDISGAVGATVRGGGTIFASGTMTAFTNGNGVRLRGGCIRCVVDGVTISNHRGWGVMVFGGNDCEVRDCLFIDSPVADTDTSAQAAGDIGIVGASKRNLVSGNICRSGNGTGIGLQTLAAGDACNHNLVVGNVVAGMRVYGLMIYRTGLAHEIRHNILANNSISDISGAIAFVDNGTHPFGAGIYVQGGEDSLVLGNSVARTHTANVTFAENLAPGGIGVTELRRVTVSGNLMSDCGMFGLFIADPNGHGAAAGVAIVSGNQVRVAKRTGIIVRQRGWLRIEGNVIDDVVDQGILVANTGALRESVHLVGNTVTGAGAAGIQMEGVSRASLCSNDISDTARVAPAYPVYVNHAKDIRLEGNQVAAGASIAVVVDTDVDHGIFDGNLVRGNGATPIAFYLDSVMTVGSANSQRGCGATWGGAKAPSGA